MLGNKFINKYIFDKAGRTNKIYPWEKALVFVCYVFEVYNLPWVTGLCDSNVSQQMYKPSTDLAWEQHTFTNENPVSGGKHPKQAVPTKYTYYINCYVSLAKETM